MTTVAALVGACEARSYRLLWVFSPQGDDERPDPHIAVDHVSPTTSGSEDCVTRWFDGAITLGGDRWEWTPEQRVAVVAWIERLHTLPLEAIP